MELDQLDEPPLPNYFIISAHAELRMIERDVLTADLFAVRRGDPLIEWQPDDGAESQDAPPGSGRRVRMIGFDLQRRLLRVILESPNEDGFSVVVTVFDASEADRRRYRRYRRRRSQH